MDSAALKTVPIDAPTISSPDQQAMRHALGHFATGVTVITALDGQGSLVGLTANAFTSVSLDPPLILACLDRSVRCYQAIIDTKAFTIHVLDGSQKHVAMGFARKGGDRNGICSWSLTEDGRPLLSTFHAALECSLHAAYPGGDHMIVVGRVEQIHMPARGTPPLLYYRGQILPFPQA